MATYNKANSSYQNSNKSLFEVFMVADSDGQPFSGYSIDAFGRMRISNPVTLFDDTHQYELNPRKWDTGLSNNGIFTHLPNESSIELSANGTPNAHSAILQSKNYIRYQPGKSQEILMTFVMGNPDTNLVRRVGYFDDENGVFLEQTDTDVAFVVRSKANGSIVDTRIVQDNWNTDKFDGTGFSEITLDLTKTQILFIDFEWLGVGSVRFGFVVDGKIYYCHKQHHANSLTEVYMTTANLPVRYEIINDGETTANNNMKAICCSVISEGGIETERFSNFAASTGPATRVAGTDWYPVIAIRPANTYNNIVNRSTIIPENFKIGLDTAVAIEVGVILNPTAITNASANDSFVSVSDNSAVEYCITGNAISGGELLTSDFIVGTVQAKSFTGANLLGETYLALSANTDTRDTLVLAVRVATGTANVLGSITWTEKK